MTVILASSVIYELIGPACAKFALFRSGSIRPGAALPLYPPEPEEKTVAE